MTGSGHLDAAYEQLRDFGPEFEGFLSNHGPMAADALVRLGHAGDVDRWVGAYVGKLEEAPRPHVAIDVEEWREVLGDPSRLGDWCALFELLLRERPWDAVLAEWWPRLSPGAVASATHCLIRVGHAVRALREHETPERLEEFGRALGYWAARWQSLPSARPRGTWDTRAAFDAVPAIGRHGGTRTRLAQLAESADWTPSLARLRGVDEAADVPAALDDLVDVAVAGYGRCGHHNPVMLVHAATGPRAIGLILPSLPQEYWRGAFDTAWLAAAAIRASFRGDVPARDGRDRPPPGSVGEAAELAVAGGDEHAIKFTEVAVESHHRGNPAALAAAGLASSLLGSPGS